MKIVYNGSVQHVIVPLVEGGTLEATRLEPVEVDEKIGHRLVGERSVWEYAEIEETVNTTTPTNPPVKGNSKKQKESI
jgi:hypothetical protein